MSFSPPKFAKSRTGDGPFNEAALSVPPGGADLLDDTIMDDEGAHRKRVHPSSATIVLSSSSDCSV